MWLETSFSRQDLKKVKPAGAANPWVMLLACDFTTNRMWAWDLDDLLAPVQIRLLRFFCEVETLLVMYSDNPAQFLSVVELAVKDLLGVAPGTFQQDTLSPTAWLTCRTAFSTGHQGSSAHSTLCPPIFWVPAPNLCGGSPQTSLPYTYPPTLRIKSSLKGLMVRIPYWDYTTGYGIWPCFFHGLFGP